MKKNPQRSSSVKEVYSLFSSFFFSLLIEFSVLTVLTGLLLDKQGQAEVSGPVTGCWATCVRVRFIYSLNIETHTYDVYTYLPRARGQGQMRPFSSLSSLPPVPPRQMWSTAHRSSTRADSSTDARARARVQPRHTTLMTTTLLLVLYTFLPIYCFSSSCMHRWPHGTYKHLIFVVFIYIYVYLVYMINIYEVIASLLKR